MKVAIVCPYAWDVPGGVQTHIIGLAAALRERAHDVAVLAPRSLGAEPDDGVTPIGRAVPIPINGSIAPVALGPDAVLGIRRALKAIRPDVVHVHEPLAPPSLFAVSAAEAPVVGTFHAASDRSFAYAVARPLLRRVVGKLSVRTAVSDEARALASRYFPGEYVLTPNGIDARRFSAADAGSEDRTVLFFSRLERRKGLPVLIQAMTRLRDEATLMVAGGGPHRRACEKLASDLFVNARFVGRVPEEEKPAVFASAAVYCAPALRGESFGIVLLEAMAAGTPVVCSDLVGFRAAAGDGALYFPVGDAAALADALRSVLGEESVRRGLINRGRARAEAFDWRRLVVGVEAVYERAAAAYRPV